MDGASSVAAAVSLEELEAQITAPAGQLNAANYRIAPQDLGLQAEDIRRTLEARPALRACRILRAMRAAGSKLRAFCAVKSMARICVATGSSLHPKGARRWRAGLRSCRKRSVRGWHG
jgi:hypothetical protein